MSLFKKLFDSGSQNRKKEENPKKMDNGERGLLLHNFHRTIKKTINKDELENVPFAMWLPCQEDSIFTSSEISNLWSLVYENTKNSWTYITADFLKKLGVAKEEDTRIDLPNDFMIFPYLTTDNVQIILSISREKGIRLHFSETTPYHYRLNYLKSFTEYCRAWNELIVKFNGDRDEAIGFTDWWQTMLEVAKQTEQKKPLTGIGQVAL